MIGCETCELCHGKCLKSKASNSPADTVIGFSCMGGPSVIEMAHQQLKNGV
jgi:hypothetical protein